MAYILVFDKTKNDFDYIDETLFDSVNMINYDTSIPTLYEAVSYFDCFTLWNKYKNLYSLKGWVNTTDLEKEYLSKMNVGDPNTEIIPFYMSYYGMTQTEAIMFFGERYETQLNNRAKICAERINNKLPTIFSLYLDKDQIEIFMHATKDFFLLYKEKAYLGTNYGDSSDGIMDFIENTGGYAGSTTSGLNGFPLSQSAIDSFGGDENLARESFRSDLVNWLIHQIFNGKYIKL